jgi:clan AA aspartic protease (TIGR02281 family)
MSDRCWVWGALLRSTLFLLAVAILGLPHAVQAQVYTWTDADGRVHYSDVPVGQGAKRVDMGTGNTVHNPDFNQQRLRASIPYRDIAGQMHVQGQVNGVAVDFIVDTGASLMVIPRAVAQQAGIGTEGTGSIPIQTANGLINAPLVSVGSFDLGSLHADDVSAVVHDIDASGQVGLLGMNFLGAYKMTIDHQQHMLMLEPK